MAKCTSVQSHSTFQGLFFSSSPKSSLGEDFLEEVGLMRSFVVKKVMRNKTKQSAAQMLMVAVQPYCLSVGARTTDPTWVPATAAAFAACWPANLVTSGSVSAPTMNCAAFTKTKRNEFNFARSFMSPVITPPSAAYGMLFIE